MTVIRVKRQLIFNLFKLSIIVFLEFLICTATKRVFCNPSVCPYHSFGYRGWYSRNNTIILITITLLVEMSSKASSPHLSRTYKQQFIHVYEY